MPSPKFRSAHPNFRQYSDEPYASTYVPDSLTGALSGVLLRLIDDQGISLRPIVDRVRSHAGDGPTGNWSPGPLAEDLSAAFRSLARNSDRFPKFMDALLDAVDVIQRRGPHDVIEDANETLRDQELGYEISRGMMGELTWTLREPQHTLGAVVDEIQERVEDICSQTTAHLDQLKRQLEVGDERSRKDALRDALTALETLMRQLTGTHDVRAATAALKADNSWGPPRLLNEGQSVWESVHALHPDVRHGDPRASSLPRDEASFWIRRVLAFAHYLAERHSLRAAHK